MPKNSVIPVFIPHAGCPHDCVFCDQRRISGHASPPAPEEVSEIIGSAVGKLSASAELAFYGGSFTCLPLEDQRAYLEAAAPFLLSGAVSRIRVSTRPDAVSVEILNLLSSHGVETVELGAQSLNDGVLAKANRGHLAADVENASRLVKASGLKLILQLMFGLPGDTPQSAAESCRRAAALSPDGVRFYPVVVLRGTALYDMMLRGEYSPLSVGDAVSLCAGVLPIFTEKNIPVIRLGLNPTDELSGGAAVAGAYHPAFGELTWSRYFLNLAFSKLEKLEVRGKTVTLGVHPSRLSVMAGQHRCNTLALKERFSPGKIRIVPANVTENELSVAVG